MVAAPTKARRSKRPQRPLSFAWVAKKGGAGKTITSTGTAVGGTQLGQRVLYIDLDETGIGQRWFGVHDVSPERSIGHAIRNPDTVDLLDIAYEHPDIPGLSIVGNVGELQSGEFEAAVRADGQWDALYPLIARLGDRVDVVHLDTPPGTRLTGEMALFAADVAVIVGLFEPTSIFLAGEMYDKLEAWAESDPDSVPTIAGLVLTAHDPREKTPQQVLDRARADGMTVVPFHIPRTVRVTRSFSDGKPFNASRPDDIVAERFRAIAGHLSTFRHRTVAA